MFDFLLSPSITSRKMAIYISLFFLCALNLALFRFLWAHSSVQNIADALFLISFPLFIFCVIFACIYTLLLPYIGKPILIFLIIAGAVANYVMFNLGVFIDADMIRNMAETNTREARDLITWSGALWVLWGGVLPSIWIATRKIIWNKPLLEGRNRVIVFVSCLAIIALIAAGLYKQYAAFGRNNKQVIRLINPTNYTYATVRYLQKKYRGNKPLQKLDPSAVQQPIPDEEITVFVMVVGETSRAMNFSLNGYARQTNPQLSQLDIAYFKDTQSCGTATATSVPCMFSHFGRKDFNIEDASHTENALDILKQSKIDVQWRENDDGCKGVCTRLPTIEMIKVNDPQYCDGESCHDEVLVKELDNILKNIKKDTIIILHTIGSHGPTYYKRYPPAFKKFTPTCDTAEIQGCSQQAITNTYDNTILYVDHVVANAIKTLKQYPQYESGLLYVSDHGESLGENGAYLHGLPYAIAPSAQTTVPMLVWLSDVMQRNDGVDYACLKQKAAQSGYSHDNIFHSILGVMEVKSVRYQADKDVFNTCRKTPF